MTRKSNHSQAFEDRNSHLINFTRQGNRQASLAFTFMLLVILFTSLSFIS